MQNVPDAHGFAVLLLIAVARFFFGFGNEALIAICALMWVGFSIVLPLLYNI